MAQYFQGSFGVEEASQGHISSWREQGNGDHCFPCVTRTTFGVPYTNYAGVVCPGTASRPGSGTTVYTRIYSAGSQEWSGSYRVIGSNGLPATGSISFS